MIALRGRGEASKLSLHIPTIKRLLQSHTTTTSNDIDDTQWEALLKPFDLKQLRTSLTNRITPIQLCKLLQLPLNVSTSLHIFNSASTQKAYSHTFETYFLLIKKLGEAREFKLIDSILSQMKQEGVVFRETLFILIIKFYGKAELPGQAVKLLLDMKGVYSCNPSFRSYNVVLDILVGSNFFSVACNVFYDMMSKGVSPNVYSFDVVIKALCMVNEEDNTCKLVRDMTKYGCVLNSIVYNTLIYSLSKKDRVDEGLRFLDEMLLMG